MKTNISLSLAAFAFACTAMAQTLPSEMHFSDDGRMLLMGDLPNTGFYDQSQIRTINLTFGQPNYWFVLDSLYWTWTKKEIPATMEIDGITYDSVGVRFKGQSSFQQIPNSQKKSFSITVDYKIPGQDVLGYKALNLNNGYQDESFLREIFYESMIKKHVPAVKSSFCKLYINGENWGLYTNTQQLNKSYYKEWFMSNNGSSWRSHRASGQQTPDGDGTGGLNYEGPDSSYYKPQYKLKFFTKYKPWEDLVQTCDVLNNTPLNDLSTLLPAELDIDRTLWFLASEILFSDDDSYVLKGRMDYFAYWEKETGRITPLEYDGNGVMNPANVNWSPFFNEDSVNYPLMNKLFKIPEYRQRYLAHLRTLMKEYFTSSIAESILDAYKNQIDTIVQNDPKKIYSYTAFQNEMPVLKNFITNRRLLFESNAEVAEVSPVISNVAWYIGNTPWGAPSAGQAVTVNAAASSPAGIFKMNLYYATGLVGNFTRLQMYDDGNHDDGQAGDGIFGAIIPAQVGGEWVRFYIEAVSNNSSKTVSYDPAGAEHNVYVYYVSPLNSNDTSIVINEIMAANISTMADDAGDFDDWVEIHNKSSQDKNISNFILTDNSWNLDKWKFPQGTIIPANGYLIVWADEDSSQGPYHANFKLSGSGENLMLLDSTGKLLDSINWSEQTPDMSYARVPNGTGDFVIETSTFSFNNDWVLSNQTPLNSESNFVISPNPNKGKFTIKASGSRECIEGSVVVYNALGALYYINDYTIDELGKNSSLEVDMKGAKPGIYFVQIVTDDTVLNKKVVIK